VLDVVRLKEGRVSEVAQSASGGLDHETMIEMAESAGMRRTLVTIADQTVGLMERVISLVPEWRLLPKVQVKRWNRLGLA
jgi:hypothetical protein